MTIDPIVIGPAIVTGLQSIVSREVAGTDVAVVTVGSFQSGFKENIIPDTAELMLSVRTFEAGVRDRVLGAISRVAAGEAAARGAEQGPDVVLVESFPPVVNAVASTDRVRGAFTTAFGAAALVDPGLVTGSEDVGLLASAAGAECVYWLLGGADPALFAAAADASDLVNMIRAPPSNHSPLFAPMIEPTLTTGVAALTAAARAWLTASEG